MSLLVIIGCVAAALTFFFIGFMIGRIGTINGHLPRRAFWVYNFEPVQHGLPPERVAISRDKRSGNYLMPAADLTEQGHIVVEERFGFAGSGRRSLHWKASSLQVFHTLKKPIGMYAAEHLQVELRNHLDQLQHENNVFAEKNAELQGLVEDLQRGQSLRIDERVDKTIKAAKELVPMSIRPQQRRTG